MREAYHNFSELIKRQLFWRDFYAHVLYAFPNLGHPVDPKYEKIAWDNNRTWFTAWCNGKTGFPVVDACMRQLNTTGYMHNRGRLIVASFLTKTLLIDWRWGEKYFAQNLVDYDVASNSQNWLWIAGGGADSQEYFRIFSPWEQSKKNDPDCVYIKQWEFDEVFWNDVPMILTRNEKNEYILWNNYMVSKNMPILEAICPADNGFKLTRKSDEEIVDTVLDHLKLYFKNVPFPKS